MIWRVVTSGPVVVTFAAVVFDAVELAVLPPDAALNKIAAMHMLAKKRAIDVYATAQMSTARMAAVLPQVQVNIS
jgi:hypothetical protein